MTLTVNLQLDQELRMSGAIPSLHLYVFIELQRTNSPFSEFHSNCKVPKTVLPLQIIIIIIIITSSSSSSNSSKRARGGAVVEALRYKPVDRGIDSRWCH
jgi:hypothetical protein